MAKKRKQSNRPPSVKAQRWHSAREELTGLLADNNKTVSLISGYVQVTKRDDFRATIKPEELTKLADSIKVVSSCTVTLSSALEEATKVFKSQLVAGREQRDPDVLESVISNLHVTVNSFAENCITTGHLDNVNEVLQDVVGRLDLSEEPTVDTASPEVEETPVSE